MGAGISSWPCYGDCGRYVSGGKYCSLCQGDINSKRKQWMQAGEDRFRNQLIQQGVLKVVPANKSTS